MQAVPDNFLGLPPEASRLDWAAVRMLPVPLEATVSYGGGTAAGPAAIIKASQQVELYDREYDHEPALEYGIHTLPALSLPQDPARARQAIAAAVEAICRAGCLPVCLGGEHSLSAGALEGVTAVHEGPITVVQIDAHSDLRDSYEGDPFSHACVARRMLENPQVAQLLQVGVRSVCPEEVEVARTDERVRVWYSEELLDLTWMEELRARVAGRRVYLSIDVDGLDPAVVPATGTPEPDGLSWTEALGLIRLLADEAEIIGIDCVELAPREGLHHADFAVAKLLYKAISYAMEAIVEAMDDEDDEDDNREDRQDDGPGRSEASGTRRRLPPLSPHFR